MGMCFQEAWDTFAKTFFLSCEPSLFNASWIHSRAFWGCSQCHTFLLRIVTLPQQNEVKFVRMACFWLLPHRRALFNFGGAMHSKMGWDPIPSRSVIILQDVTKKNAGLRLRTF